PHGEARGQEHGGAQRLVRESPGDRRPERLREGQDSGHAEDVGHQDGGHDERQQEQAANSGGGGEGNDQEAEAQQRQQRVHAAARLGDEEVSVADEQVQARAPHRQPRDQSQRRRPAGGQLLQREAEGREEPSEQAEAGGNEGGGGEQEPGDRGSIEV